MISCPSGLLGKAERVLGRPIIDISYGIILLGKEISMVSFPSGLLGQAETLLGKAETLLTCVKPLREQAQDPCAETIHETVSAISND